MTSRKSLACAFALGLAFAATWPGCSSSDSPPPAAARALSPAELALRTTLGVPPGAKNVVVFAQTAHLDIDWQKTFDDYYTTFVGDVFIEARQILQQQPRAYYSVAEMAFLEHHLDVHPEELAPLKAAAASGALRIVGGGMTSPDTLLPETELLARDYLYGIQFAEDTLGAHPHAAWLPDSFGHSATAPDMLVAAGYDSVAFSRVDGAPTLLEHTLHPNQGPKPGSTAETLLGLGSADFYWRGAGGAKILAHWMAAPGLYCQGDNIDYIETLEVPGGHVGTFDNATADTDAKIDEYASQLTPYAKTPYLFVPVGCDFAHPKQALIEYLDGYNKRRYPTTGVWAVAATFEEYATLVSAWGDVLPELSIDITPYFMGFYGSRAGVKRGARDAARPFFVAETFASALGASGATIMQSAAPELKLLTRADHHDFVTGTSTDDVLTKEQMPLLAETEAAGVTVLGQVASAISARIPANPGAAQRVLAFNASGLTRSDVAEVVVPISAGIAPAFHATANGSAVPLEVVGAVGPMDTSATVRLALTAMKPFSWRAIDLIGGAAAPPNVVTLALLDSNGAPATGAAVTRVVLSNADVRAEWDKKAGFVLTSLKIDGAEAIAGDSGVVHDYSDMGGLWRMGNEMSGCTLSPLPAPGGDETVAVLENTGLSARVTFTVGSTIREASLSAGATGLELALTTGAAAATTRTMSFALAAPEGALLNTSLAGGTQERALERVYTPTFWPAVAWAEVSGWTILLRQSTGVRMSTAGAIELIAARNAQSEQCDIEGDFVGTDPDTHRIEWRIEHTTSVANAEAAAQAFNRPIDLELVTTAKPAATQDLAPEVSLVQVDGEGIVSAIKPAERGTGVILRTLLLPGPVTVHLAPPLAGLSVTSVDIAERDLKTIGPAGDSVVFDATTWGSVASARLH